MTAIDRSNLTARIAALADYTEPDVIVNSFSPNGLYIALLGDDFMSFTDEFAGVNHVIEGDAERVSAVLGILSTVEHQVDRFD